MKIIKEFTVGQIQHNKGNFDTVTHICGNNDKVILTDACTNDVNKLIGKRVRISIEEVSE